MFDLPVFIIHRHAQARYTVVFSPTVYAGQHQLNQQVRNLSITRCNLMNTLSFLIIVLIVFKSFNVQEFQINPMNHIT